MGKSQAERSPKDDWPDVQAAVRRLREAHRIGRRILDEAGSRAEYGQHRVLDVAREHSFGEEAGRNLRRFAAMYSKAELDHLCGLCRDHRRALGLWSAFKFLTIPYRPSRQAFARDAIAGHWSHARIERELRHRYHRESTPRGRKPRLPESQGEALVLIAEMSNGFIRWAAQLDQERGTGWLPKRVGTDLAQAIGMLKSLQKSVNSALARSQAEQAGKSHRSRPRR